jgi:hypothetical protein
MAASPGMCERHEREDKAAFAPERIHFTLVVISGRDHAETSQKDVGKVTVRNNNWPAILPALNRESLQIQCNWSDDREKGGAVFVLTSHKGRRHFFLTRLLCSIKKAGLQR